MVNTTWMLNVYKSEINSKNHRNKVKISNSLIIVCRQFIETKQTSFAEHVNERFTEKNGSDVKADYTRLS